MNFIPPSSLIVRAVVFVVITIMTPLCCNKILHAEGRINPSFMLQDSTDVDSRALIDETEPPSLTLPSLTFIEEGVASWYGPRFHGRRTACGERYNMHDFTAAHQTLPFGTLLRVTNLATMQTTLVRVNDRGPYVGGRIIDLSYSAAKEINLSRQGTGDVKIEIVSIPDTIPTVEFTEAGALIPNMFTAISYTADVEPLVVKSTSVRVVHKTENLKEALKTWKELYQSNKNVYLVAQKNPDPLQAQALESLAKMSTKKSGLYSRERVHPSAVAYQYQLASLGHGAKPALQDAMSKID